jgi:hypothetical protein
VTLILRRRSWKRRDELSHGRELCDEADNGDGVAHDLAALTETEEVSRQQRRIRGRQLHPAAIVALDAEGATNAIVSSVFREMLAEPAGPPPRLPC